MHLYNPSPEQVTEACDLLQECSQLILDLCSADMIRDQAAHDGAWELFKRMEESIWLK